MKTILVVDDEYAIVEALHLLLRDEGYQVLTANGGRQAQEILRKVHPDVMLLDVMMPDLDGRALFEQMQQDPDLRNIPVVMMSAAIIDPAKLGAPAFIQKPFNIRELLETVGRLSNGRG